MVLWVQYSTAVDDYISHTILYCIDYMDCFIMRYFSNLGGLLWLEEICRGEKRHI